MAWLRSPLSPFWWFGTAHTTRELRGELLGVWQESVGPYSGGLSKARNRSEVRSEDTKRRTPRTCQIAPGYVILENIEVFLQTARSHRFSWIPPASCMLWGHSTQKSVTKHRAERTQHHAGYSTHYNHRCDTKSAQPYHDMCWHSIRCFNFLAFSLLGTAPPTCSMHIPTLQSPKYHQPPIKSKKARGYRSECGPETLFPLLQTL